MVVAVLNATRDEHHVWPPQFRPFLSPRSRGSIILRGYEYLEEARFLLLQFPAAAVGRNWLGAILPSIQDAKATFPPGLTAINLAFTFAGLKTLDLVEWRHPKALLGSSREFL